MLASQCGIMQTHTLKLYIHHMGLLGTCSLIHMLHTSTIHYAKCTLLWTTEHVMMSHVDKLIHRQLYGQEAACADSCRSMLAPQCVVTTIAGCLFGACCTASWFLSFVSCGRHSAKQCTKATIVSCRVYCSCMTLSHMGHWVQSSAMLGGHTPLPKRRVCLACPQFCLLCVMNAD